MNLTKNNSELNTSGSGEKVIFSFLWNEPLKGLKKEQHPHLYNL